MNILDVLLWVFLGGPWAVLICVVALCVREFYRHQSKEVHKCMSAEQAIYEDLIKELRKRDVPFIRRETLEWLREYLHYATEHDVQNFTSDDIGLLADVWEHAFLVMEDENYAE